MHHVTKLNALLPGLIMATLAAIASKFLSAHYGVPAMLLALLLGLSLNSLFEGTKAKAGIVFCSKTLLRFAVGLLGVRVSYDLITQIGAPYLALVALGVVLTILLGYLIARLTHGDRAMGILTGGSVAICGASAAVAVAAVLPNREQGERQLTATVFGVTVLSTVAMIVYPILTHQLGLSDADAGFFVGATIHDVAQVVGAGLSISENAGSVATLTKLFRVSLLAPIVLVISIMILRVNQHRADSQGNSPPLIPGFVLLFLGLALLNSLHWIPDAVVQIVSAASNWGLLIAIAAVGVKTSFKGFWSSGSTVLYLIFAETIFLALFILSGMFLIH